MNTVDMVWLSACLLFRYEHLEDDVVEALRIINERRDPKLPPLPPPTFRWKKKGKVGRAVCSVSTRRFAEQLCSRHVSSVEDGHVNFVCTAPF